MPGQACGEEGNGSEEGYLRVSGKLILICSKFTFENSASFIEFVKKFIKIMIHQQIQLFLKI